MRPNLWAISVKNGERLTRILKSSHWLDIFTSKWLSVACFFLLTVPSCCWLLNLWRCTGMGRKLNYLTIFSPLLPFNFLSSSSYFLAKQILEMKRNKQVSKREKGRKKVSRNTSIIHGKWIFYCKHPHTHTQFLFFLLIFTLIYVRERNSKPLRKTLQVKVCGWNEGKKQEVLNNKFCDGDLEYVRVKDERVKKWMEERPLP